MKNKKRKLVILSSIIALFGIALITLGTSYALFNINVTKNKTFKIAVGKLELTIDDATQGNTFTDGKLVINSMVPMKDATGMQQAGYKLRLTNTGSIDSTYSIYLDDVTLNNLPSGITGRLDNSLVRVNLTNVTTNTNHTYSLNELVNRELETGNLTAGSHNDYILRIWLDYSAGNTSQNKYFAAKIRIDGIQFNDMTDSEATKVMINSEHTNCANMQCAVDELASMYR